MSKFTESFQGEQQIPFLGEKAELARPFWHPPQQYILHRLEKRRFFAARTRFTAFQAASVSILLERARRQLWV